MFVASSPSETRIMASRVGLSNGWPLPRRDKRVAAKKASTVAPVSRTGLSARLAQVRFVNWLKVDIANCSLDPIGFAHLPSRNSGAEPIRNDHGYEQRHGCTTNHGCQDRQRFGLEDIQIGNHTDASGTNNIPRN